MKSNCWEYKNCGRQPGGVNAKELGVCSAAVEERADSVNSGKNAGRSCWMVAGTLCGGQVQGTAAMKSLNCLKCDFYKLVRREEKADGTYIQPVDILILLKQQLQSQFLNGVVPVD